MKKRTTEEFIAMCKEKHSDRYDYSLVDYQSKDLKVKIICKVHGIFEQVANAHLRGFGCRHCGYKVSTKLRTIPTEDFISKSKTRFGDRFTYNQVVYVNSNTKVKLFCKEHNITFEVTPSNHFKVGGNGGCRFCRVQNATEAKLKGAEYFISKMSEKFKHIDFSGCVLTKASDKIYPICSAHGKYETTANSVLSKSSKHGCPQCSIFNPPDNTLCCFYILKIGEDYLKYGISTNFKYRLSRIKFNSTLSVDTLYVFDMYRFGDAKIFEKEFKLSVKSEDNIDKLLFPDGHTETIPIKHLSRVLEFLAEKHMPD